MNSHVLSPPNALMLSDELICDVKQRSGGSRANATTEAISVKRSETSVDVPATAAVVSPATARLISHSALPSTRRGRSCLASDLKTARKIMSTINAANHQIDVELQNTIVAEALKKKIRHRERCRVNQARYRKKQLKAEIDVRNAIEKLRNEIEDLESRSNDPSWVPTSPTPWSVAGDYFRHFNYFLVRPGTRYKAASEFLRGIMAPGVVDGSVSGVDAQIENWRRFALYFGNISVKLRGIKMPAEHTLVADVTTTVAVTWNTLQFVFPHLNSDGKGGTEGGAWSPVASRVLGQQLVLHGSVHFGWDTTSDKVVRFQMQKDLLTPVLNLLGSLKDASLVFSRAFVTPDFRFIC